MMVPTLQFGHTASDYAIIESGNEMDIEILKADTVTYLCNGLPEPIMLTEVIANVIHN